LPNGSLLQHFREMTHFAVYIQKVCLGGGGDVAHQAGARTCAKINVHSLHC